ncbi:MAG TPA: UDP-N-acetylmuramoyl-tripeptide--D-alanyl-D-alanine ligase [Polyangiales bacterium]|nr:UDP-N-acetylmuramoyl-tripeptide--D-alanyl-D-alanine ligase [Polyangiales bacterium]
MATPIPANACRFSLDEVLRATSATLSGNRQAVFEGVTTDSRGDVRGKLFIALEGENFDGHRFAADAVRAGARGVLSSRDVSVSGDASLLRVPSTLDALGALARAHRRRWQGQLIAVAGSAGKTTTKSAIGAVLAACAPGAVHVTPGNLNNRVGVPHVLFGLMPEHRFAVIEVGTNQTGEVRELAGVCEADLGVLTLIALEHTAGLGNLDAIELEEGSLLEQLGSEALAIANADDARCARQLARSSAATKLSYGNAPNADYRISARTPLGADRSRVSITPRGRAPFVVETALLGDAGALALSAALAVAERALGRNLDASLFAEVCARLPIGEPGRLCPVTLKDGTIVLDDTYNANPASVKSSLTAAWEVAEGLGARLVLVLGEMRELGAESQRLHREAGDLAADSRAAALIAVGGDARFMAEAAVARGVSAEFAEDAEAALQITLARVQPGDVVLVKASRGVRAERVVDGLLANKGRAA